MKDGKESTIGRNKRKRSDLDSEEYDRFEDKYLPTSLGNFNQVIVDFQSRTCTCNCEMYHFTGTCFHTKLFPMIEF